MSGFEPEDGSSILSGGTQKYILLSMKEETRFFNIAIYPPASILKKVLAVSKQLRSKDSLFVLDNKKYFPHLTLYMVELPLKNIPQVKNELLKLSNSFQSFTIQPLGCRHYKEGYTNITYRRSRELNKLQRQVIALIRPWSKNFMKEKDSFSTDTISKTELKNLTHYGYREVGTTFSPHITFTKLKKFTPSVFSDIEKINFSFHVKRIGLFYLSKYGTCRKLIRLFNFS